MKKGPRKNIYVKRDFTPASVSLEKTMLDNALTLFHVNITMDMT